MMYGTGNLLTYSGLAAHATARRLFINDSCTRDCFDDHEHYNP
jgi:hypothetical protein